jgi:oligoendopeptidase F
MKTLYTISTFASCQLSTDALHKKAKELSGRLSIIQSKFSKACKPVDLFLQRAPENFINDLLSKEKIEPYSFGINHARKLKDTLLSTSEEVLVSGLSQDGLHAWGKLYNSISGSMKVFVGDEEMGLATASSLIRQGDREQRKKAYEGIDKAWRQHEESAAAILNAINGWRLEMNQNRSHTKEVHYLDVSCHQSRIERETLNSLMEETYRQRDIGQQALASMAKLMKVDKLGPHDLIAPAPLSEGDSGQPISFPEAINLIADAFSELTPEMGEFAKMMAANGWIDAKPTEARSPGAYCTKFHRTREPRVFMTYTGSMGNVITLAHELGHAYHNWVMRDLPIEKTFYSMTLAETASIFAETLVKKALLQKSNSREERLKILWQDAESAAALLINIPARYEFEKDMVEARKERPQSPEELRSLMGNAWKKWYEDTLTSYDEMFWANKLHFSISSLGFYNYPYLFGYLFSLGIYSQKDKYGDGFTKLYHDILRDTGTMTAEDLIKKHLDKDITKPSFWSDSLSVVRSQVEEFTKEV